MRAISLAERGFVKVCDGSRVAAWSLHWCWSNTFCGALMQHSVRLDHRQQQTLSPRLQHAVRLLQMSSLDFVRELHDVVGRNPFLEQDEAEPEEADVASVSA